MTKTSLRIFVIVATGGAALALAVLWLAPWVGQEEAHAQELADACAKATASPYFDLVHVSEAKPMGGEIDERLETKVSVSGPDVHFRAHWDDGRSFEGINVDGLSYRRDGDGPWAVSKTEEGGGIVSSYYGLSFTPQG